MGVVTPAAHQVIRGSRSSLHWKASGELSEQEMTGIARWTLRRGAAEDGR